MMSHLIVFQILVAFLTVDGVVDVRHTAIDTSMVFMLKYFPNS